MPDRGGARGAQHRQPQPKPHADRTKTYPPIVHPLIMRLPPRAGQCAPGMEHPAVNRGHRMLLLRQINMFGDFLPGSTVDNGRQ